MSTDDQTPVTRWGKVLGVLVAVRTAARAARRRNRAAEPAPAGRPESQVVGGTSSEPTRSDGTEADLDPSKRTVPANPRTETLVAGLLLLAAGFAFAFTVLYIVLSGNTQPLGVAMGGALCLLAAACIIAGKFVVPQETHVEERGPLLDEEQTEEVVTMVEEGGQGISRRVLLAGAGGVAGAALITAAATPLASLGPTASSLHGTPWARGVRLVDDEARPYLASDIQIGTFYTALPENGDPESFGAGVLVVRLSSEFIHLPAARRDWAPDGILAYSKICPHAGCAISLFRYPTYAPTSQVPAFTCPCHYSTFLPGEGGRLIFGPAGRALPQLPLMVDSQGYLRAAGSFHEDIGPSWWGIHRSES
jgi:ubiquinol-cytochrome c reductase iron-sulfur subunit